MAHDPQSEDPSESRPKDAPPGVPIGGRTGGPSSLGAAGRYAGLGLQFAVSILLFLYLGQWADRKLGTGGVLVIVGVFVGAGAAFYSMYRKLTADEKRKDL